MIPITVPYWGDSRLFFSGPRVFLSVRSCEVLFDYNKTEFTSKMSLYLAEQKRCEFINFDPVNFSHAFLVAKQVGEKCVKV